MFSRREFDLLNRVLNCVLSCANQKTFPRCTTRSIVDCMLCAIGYTLFRDSTLFRISPVIEVSVIWRTICPVQRIQWTSTSVAKGGGVLRRSLQHSSQTPVRPSPLIRCCFPYSVTGLTTMLIGNSYWLVSLVIVWSLVSIFINIRQGNNYKIFRGKEVLINKLADGIPTPDCGDASKKYIRS